MPHTKSQADSDLHVSELLGFLSVTNFVTWVKGEGEAAKDHCNHVVPEHTTAYSTVPAFVASSVQYRTQVTVAPQGFIITILRVVVIPF